MFEEIRVVEGHLFRPRYDTLARDWDRLQEFTVELLHAGEITQVPGKSLSDSHIQPAFERVLDGYFARHLFDQIEAHFTRFDAANTWPYEKDLVRWRQLADAGQSRRVVRLWRNHIACVKAGFWYRIAARNAGYRKPKFSRMSDQADRNSYANLIGQIPVIKDDILGLMAYARSWFDQMDVPQADLARLAADRAEVEAEARRRPKGQPDPRAMTEEVFWEVIGGADDASVAAHVDAVTTRLEQFKASAITAFHKHLHSRLAEAYRSDLWALAYLLCDGCSDDMFEAFRCWLILQGRAVFDAALRDPDAFDPALMRGPIEGALALIEAPHLAYDVRTGKAMKRVVLLPKTRLSVDFVEEDAAISLPRVARAVA